MARQTTKIAGSFSVNFYLSLEKCGAFQKLHDFKSIPVTEKLFFFLQEKVYVYLITGAKVQC